MEDLSIAEGLQQHAGDTSWNALVREARQGFGSAVKSLNKFKAAVVGASNTAAWKLESCSAACTR